MLQPFMGRSATSALRLNIAYWIGWLDVSKWRLNPGEPKSRYNPRIDLWRGNWFAEDLIDLPSGVTPNCGNFCGPSSMPASPRLGGRLIAGRLVYRFIFRHSRGTAPISSRAVDAGSGMTLTTLKLAEPIGDRSLKA